MSSPPSSSLLLSGNSSTSFLNSLLRNPPNWEIIQELDLTGVTFVTPVVSVLAGVAAANGWGIIYPEDHKACDYLKWMMAGNYYDETRYLPVVTCSAVNDCRRIARDINKIIQGWIPGDTASDVSYSLGEAMDNVFDHARSKQGLYLQAQRYPQKKTLEIVVVDQGRGVARSLRDNPLYSELDDMECFEQALTMGISAQPEKHSGEGLSTSLEWIKANTDNGARGVVVSYAQVWVAGKRKTGVVDTGACCWPGSFIWLSIPFVPNVPMVEVWNNLGLLPE